MTIERSSIVCIKGLDKLEFVEEVIRMKKILIIMLVLTCLLGLVGCDPGTNHLYKDELIANTVRIEFFHYENEEPKLLNLGEKEKPSFDLSKATLIATLDESHFEDILSDVAEIDFQVFGTALNEPMGKTLVLYQSNGEMIVLFGCVYTNEEDKTWYYGDCYVFDENGVFVEHIGDVGYLFLDMVETTYFENNP